MCLRSVGGLHDVIVQKIELAKPCMVATYVRNCLSSCTEAGGSQVHENVGN
jgi:hypothetical protein